jgi:long-chain acyl-CoA synthetase
MARYKVPKQVEFRTELPRSMVGKVLRRQLLQEERDARAADTAAGDATRRAS